MCIRDSSYLAFRKGYPTNNTKPGRPIYIGAEGNSDKVLEWDGGEPNNDEDLPLTIMSVHNLTLLSSNVVDTSNGNAQGGGIRCRRQTQSTFNNLVFQGVDRSLDGSTQGLITPALLWQNQDTALTGNNSGGVPKTLTKGTGQNFHWMANAVSSNASGVRPTDFSGVQLAGPLVSDLETQFNALGSGNVKESASQVVAGGQYIKNGLDPRLAAGVGAVTSSGPSPAAGLVPVTYAGFCRDNTWLSGWSVLDYLENLVTTNIARPAVTLGLSGSNPTVTFTAAAGVGGRSAIYVVEKSSDERVWTPVNTAVTAPGVTTVTDSTTSIAAGTPVYYRVYAL